MAKLLPFRQIDENDVVNLFAYDGDTATRGLIVALDTSATWDHMAELDTVSINNSYANTVSDRYSVKARVKACPSGTNPLGMLMYDVAEVDENGEKLIWHPRKAHEMQVSLSGQAVPVVTQGLVLVELGSEDTINLVVDADVSAYGGGDTAGGILTSALPGTAVKIGKFLGPKNATDNKALLKLEL
tara:strand:+ start:450 stop:1007 length:558 start_codon:yes stop_codon:yes gene_type:complete